MSSDAALAAKPGARARRATGVGWAVVVVLSLAGAVLTVLVWGDLATADAVSNLGGAVAAVVYATLGVLIVRRAANRIGWLLMGIGADLAIMAAASAYAVLGVTHPGSLPASKLVGLLAEGSFVPAITGFGFMLLLFPTGQLRSRRWRLFAAVALAGTALALAGFAVHPRLVALPAPGGVSLRFPNPLGVPSLDPVFSAVLIGTPNSAGVLLALILAASFVAMALRYRSGRRELRQQIKWVALVTGTFLGCLLAALLASAASGSDTSPVTVTAYEVVTVLVLFGYPAAITVAILKHGLYHIDRIISRTLAYAIVTGLLVGVYAGLVLLATRVLSFSSPVAAAASTLAAAVLFNPLRRRVQQGVDRRFNRAQYDAERTVAAFSARLQGAVELDVVSSELLAAVQRALEPAHVVLWVRQVRP
jgi:hypothetical protein